MEQQQTYANEELAIPSESAEQEVHEDSEVQEAREVPEVPEVQEIPKVSEALKPLRAEEVVRNHRFSALVNGFCMGIGFVFLLSGIIMPILMPEQLVSGLSMVIGAILCVALGIILEVYQLAKLD